MTFPASIPLRRDPPEGAGAGGGDFSGLAALGLLLVAAVFAWAWWRKRQSSRARASTGPGDTAEKPANAPAWGRWLGMPAAREVRSLGSTRLTAKHSVHEVQWQGRRLLIGCTDNAICVLAEAPAATATATATAVNTISPNGEMSVASTASAPQPVPQSAPPLAEAP